MKTTGKWIMAFVVGVILYGIGNLFISFLVSFLLNNVPTWLAYILGCIIILFASYKVVDYAFGKVPYIYIGVRSMSLLYVFTVLVFGTIIFAALGIDKPASDYPVWLAVYTRTISFFAAFSLVREIKRVINERNGIVRLDV